MKLGNVVTNYIARVIREKRGKGGLERLFGWLKWGRFNSLLGSGTPIRGNKSRFEDKTKRRERPFQQPGDWMRSGRVSENGSKIPRWDQREIPRLLPPHIAIFRETRATRDGHTTTPNQTLAALLEGEPLINFQHGPPSGLAAAAAEEERERATRNIIRREEDEVKQLVESTVEWGERVGREKG